MCARLSPGVPPRQTRCLGEPPQFLQAPKRPGMNWLLLGSDVLRHGVLDEAKGRLIHSACPDAHVSHCTRSENTLDLRERSRPVRHVLKPLMTEHHIEIAVLERHVFSGAFDPSDGRAGEALRPGCSQKLRSWIVSHDLALRPRASGGARNDRRKCRGRPIRCPAGSRAIPPSGQGLQPAWRRCR